MFERQREQRKMSANDLNSSGKPYHEHGDQIEKQKKEPAEHPTEKDVTPHHGHDNQVRFHFRLFITFD